MRVRKKEMREETVIMGATKRARNLAWTLKQCLELRQLKRKPANCKKAFVPDWRKANNQIVTLLATM